MLHRAGQPVLLARDRRKPLQRVEVDLDGRDRAVGQRHAAVARSGLDAHLADARDARAVEHADVLVEVGAKLLLRRVALPHLTDLAPDRDGHAARLQASDQASQLCRVGGVDTLLFADGGL